ncbi:MAG: RHS repeat-associated core domain-containing protein [Pyrinomonadaceae bacterium]
MNPTCGRWAATPNFAVTYTYDNLANAVGKLTKVENSVSKTEYTEFDILGRLTKSRQTTEGTSYGDTEYKYNLSGALSETKYPSGRVVRNVLDNTGRLSIVQSKKDANHGFWDYAKGFQYTAAGAVSDMQLGNGKWESTAFNSRLQPTKIALGTVQGGDDKLNLAYEYNTSGVADNNGNVLKQTITVNSTPGQNNGFTAVQSYAYDELNRLKSATETIGGTQSWKEAYTFDRYGNKNYDEAQTTTLTRNCGTAPNLSICQQDREMENPEINPATDRIKELQPDGDSVKDYEYDPAGNTTKDPDGRTFQYDGENKQIKVSNTAGTIGEYSFDGDGKRVKKHVPATGETTHFIYDAGGKLIAEYSTIVEPTSTAKANYLTNDTLGSPRMLTDRDGNVGSRRDFLPFGAEITSALTPQRISANSYVTDELRQKFTSYERDAETDHDYAKARNHSYNLGRFTSPDDFLKDTRTVEPASWHLYVYVRNNPLKFVDSSGERVDGSGLSDDEKAQLIAEFARITGYRAEDLSFGSDGLLSISDGARSSGGSAIARRLLNSAIDSSWEFALVGVSTADVAFADHIPTLRDPITRADGTRVSAGVYGRVRVDFADFSNAVFEDDFAREAFSLGLAVLHEFVHGLYPGLSDQQGGGAGQIENDWMNPIRQELGLATRDQYSATSATFTNSQGQNVQGVQLSFTRYETIPPIDSSMTVPPENTFPVTTHVYWQLNTVGGRVKK